MIRSCLILLVALVSWLNQSAQTRIIYFIPETGGVENPLQAFENAIGFVQEISLQSESVLLYVEGMYHAKDNRPFSTHSKENVTFLLDSVRNYPDRFLFDANSSVRHFQEQLDVFEAKTGNPMFDVKNPDLSFYIVVPGIWEIPFLHHSIKDVWTDRVFRQNGWHYPLGAVADWPDWLICLNKFDLDRAGTPFTLPLP